ncbi:P-loop containing nucleoside triphosphate hydrolase protein [Rhizophagus irregularis]|uniref:P-loop containing nucleoside triphosphate hydrolase protein n=1 Tax=Rhizophagus irregularis TaxID=588596 RepID=A0A2N0RBG8_9GLOM|nr:P-loop containing nucleoside triphosphate hydrolase protein [Rhizophagus irregularis]PKC60648.1 P-loop containing nucleoside triphosphate hydrolase protein [Rhizophagus irregularis]CAB4481498.1 unnamed protein product [Rhizophagus irregularis]
MDLSWWSDVKKIVSKWITHLCGSTYRLLTPLEHAHPKKRRIIVIVEGLIGSGKSTLVKNLSQTLEKMGYSVCQILEPVDYWIETGILEKLYSNPSRFSVDFQVFAYMTRLVDINKSVAANPNADIYLLERSTESGKLFIPNFWDAIDPVEKVLLSYMFENLTELLSLDLTTAHILYYNTSLPKCMERVKKRNRSEEVVHQFDLPSGEPTANHSRRVTKEYQTILSSTHNLLLSAKGRTSHEPVMRFIYDVPNSVIEIGPDMADIDAEDSSYEKRVLIPIIDKLPLR